MASATSTPAASIRSVWSRVASASITTGDPAVAGDEVRAASLQFVRKLSGFTAPSKANEAAFQRAVTEVAASATVLIRSLTTTATPREREAEAVKARAQSAMRFGRGRPD